MNKAYSPSSFNVEVADGWRIPKTSLVSREYAEIERERLWPRVWQIACREEELPKVGSYVTYEILDESIIVVRTSETEIKAYNNACLHRGRRLTDRPCGHKTKFMCKFHGWRWKLDGTNEYVHEQQDWEGALTPENLRLTEFKVGLWGGFVFINMDPDCEPLEKFIGPVAALLDPMETEKQRYRWYITVEVDANWKVCQAAFQEAYHVAATHPQFEPFSDSRSLTYAHGPHGQLRTNPNFTPGRHNVRPYKGDGRKMLVEYMRQVVHDIQSISTDRDYQAACRVLQMPEGTTFMEALAKAGEYIRESAIASGAGYPDVTPQQRWELGHDWTIFPNIVNVFSLTAGLWYRTRPTPDNNPDKCLFEMFSLERFTPGAEPELKKRHYKDWTECEDMPFFLHDDFMNIPEVHRGLKTRGFTHMNYNPRQEIPIINLHKALDEFMGVDFHSPEHSG